MPEEYCKIEEYCSLAEELEAVKAELAEVTADKINLINAAMDGRDKYHYIAHDMGYRDMERKVKFLEADYEISNRELLGKQMEIQRLATECAEWRQDAERLAKTFVIEVYPHEWACRGCHHMGKTPDTIEHALNCPITLHRELVAKYGGEK